MESNSRLPARTTKLSQKLVVLQTADEKHPAASQYIHNSQIEDPLISFSQYDASDVELDRLRRYMRYKLSVSTTPSIRVSAYCTAKSYRSDALFRYLSNSKSHGSDGQFELERIDECICYRSTDARASTSRAPFGSGFSSRERSPPPSSSAALAAWLGSASMSNVRRSLVTLTEGQPLDQFDGSADAHGGVDSVANSAANSSPGGPDPDAVSANNDDPGRDDTPSAFKEAFYLNYGVVVLWGYDEEEERSMLKALTHFEEDRLDEDDIQCEELRCTYDPNRTRKIFNDMIYLPSPEMHMEKLAISLAIAQSVKLTYYEHWIDDAITHMRDVPHQVAEFGMVKMSRVRCVKSIGRLFNLKSSVILSKSILDTPEIFWTEPALAPLYDTTRIYMEISQRVRILDERTAVISDLLAMLNENLTKNHGESLEWIVIWLVAVCVVLAGLTIYIRIKTVQQHHFVDF
eukprot:Partr_v1_DN26259_c0_g1_i2_m48331 putative Required for meiotic nuclear division 1 homolog (S. cerevisiae)